MGGGRQLELDEVSLRPGLLSSYVEPERAAVIRGATTGWRAIEQWSPKYIAELAPRMKVPVKHFGPGNGVRVNEWNLIDYANYVVETDRCPRRDDRETPLHYCHDVPLFHMIQGLVEDVQPFPVDLLTKWYRPHWWWYAQFFIGPRGSVTPLHFDTLLTHNIFFQVRGRKLFTLIAPDEARYCGVRDWRWFDFDPERPSRARNRGYSVVNPIQVTLHPGDALYMPPGTLHHVRSLDSTISFNIDFHTKRSARRGIAAVMHGMPPKNLYYNCISAAGIFFGIPDRILFKFYKSYLSYVS